MYTGLGELLGDSLASLLGAIICIVDDDLTACVEEVPDKLFAPIGDLLSQSNRLGALLSWGKLQRSLSRQRGVR